MKKLVIRKKKKIKIHQRRNNLARILATAASIVLFVGITPVITTSAAEEGFIYHQHTGVPEMPGGCYGMPVYHGHLGNREDGGACFETPVYHTHQGSEVEGGGCYGEPVYHVHHGDETEGGSCYAPFTHTHGTGCYQEAECHVVFERGSSIRTWEQWCIHQNGVVTFEEVNVVAFHSGCAHGPKDERQQFCRACGFSSESMHGFSRLACKIDTGVILGYAKICEKTEDTIDFYLPDCGRDEKTIDWYSLSCPKTADTIDSYALSCGWDENMPCGKIIITNETSGQSEKVLLHVSVEDLTGGKLILTDNPYSWQDGAGNSLGEGESIEVDRNGTYQVTVNLENEDVDRERLKKSIQVVNVYQPIPVAEKESTHYENGSGEGKEPEEPAEIIPVLASPQPEALPLEVVEVISNGNTRKSKITASPSPVLTITTPVIEKETIKKETTTIELPQNERVEEVRLVPVPVEEKRGFFATPVGKVISITAGGLLLLAGCGLLAFWKRKSVTVMNDDGEGRMYGVGHCPVVETEEGYTIHITQAMVERSSTNRFCIKPGFFLIGKSQEQELIVCKEDKRISLILSKEMTFLL